MAGIQFTDYVPTSLVGNNSPSPTLAAEVVTGLPIPTGAFPGNAFYLTESQANQLSQTPVNNAATLLCHAGWYMVVQVAASAVAGNILAGAVGAVINVPSTNAQSQTAVPPQAVVTDGATAATAGLLGNYPVVFLNAVTPGNYTIVQIAGDGNLLVAAGATITPGTILVSATPGTVTNSSTQTALTIGLAQKTVNTPAAALVLSAAANASGGTTVYTGTITGGGSNAFAGLTFTVAGFDLTANNGTFVATASTTTTLTLANPNGVSDTHAGTATANAPLVRANIAPPFGVI